MVPANRIDQPYQQVFIVNPLKETAGYVARTPGGVRGGGRKAPLYSIVPGRSDGPIILLMVVTPQECMAQVAKCKN